MNKYIALVFMFPLYVFTVLIRIKIHTEPFQYLWCTWVFAQGYCAAIIGYLFGKRDK